MAVEQLATRRLSDQRRQIAEQMLELRGLRGKSSGKVQLMIERVDREMHEFERCTERLAALRAVHARMLRELLIGLSSDALRDEVARMQDEASATLFNLGARKAFLALCARLRGRVVLARAARPGNPRHAAGELSPAQQRVRLRAVADAAALARAHATANWN